MKHITALLLIGCIVASQTKVKGGYKTVCQGDPETRGELILDQKVVVGQEATYRSYVFENDEIIHGEVKEVGEPKPVVKKEPIPDDTGKETK